MGNYIGKGFICSDCGILRNTGNYTKLLRYYANVIPKCNSQCNFPLYLKKAGLASRNIVHKFKTFLRCIGFCFFIVFIKLRANKKHILKFQSNWSFHRRDIASLKVSIFCLHNRGAVFPSSDPLSVTQHNGREGPGTIVCACPR